MEIINALGRRKSAVARVYVNAGKGNITINGKDLALYFNESEQTPTLFYISIHFDRSGNVTGAGGLFIQAMPQCSSSSRQNAVSALDVRRLSLKSSST